MSCNSPSARLTALEAELARERARRMAAERALHRQALVVADLTAPTENVQAEAAPVPAPEAPSAVPAEDAEARAARKRAQNAERQRRYRLRQRNATPTRDGVTSAVTMVGGLNDLDLHPPTSRVTSPTCERGALVTVAATAEHSAREKPPPPSEQLPAEVQALREGWQTLVVPHGFAPWPERTPKRLLEDALRALERRPLGEWLKVFALVPRAAVCRGELPNQRGRRKDLVYLLVGEVDARGYEPADNLLLGQWSVDPEPQEAAPAPAAAPAAGTPEPPPPTDTREGWAWGSMLNTLREQRRTYALQWLEGLRPVALREGVLLLEVADRFRSDWLAEHYGGLLREVGVQHGVTQVEYVLPGGAS